MDTSLLKLIQLTDQGYLEIGAQWIHGQEGNPLFEIARDNNLLKDGYEKLLLKYPTTQLSDIQSTVEPNLYQDINITKTDDSIIFATQNGKKIPFKLAQNVYDSITKLIANAEQLQINQKQFDSRVGDYLLDQYKQMCPQQNNNDLKRILNGLFLMRAKRENIRSGCSNIFDLSLKNFSNYKEFNGHSYVELKKGYTPVIRAFMHKYEQEYLARLNLNHYMKQIYLCNKNTNQVYQRECVHCTYTNDPHKAVIKMCNATDQSNQKDFIVVCDHVVCTMSLGYLKENLNSLIEPISLITNEKRLAVTQLGFGTINKIFLFYQQPFWSPQVKLINMIWVPEKTDFNVDKLIYRNSNKKIWYEDICKFEVVDSYPNALSGWIAGSEEFEKLDDKTIASECTRLLRKFLSDESIPEPSSIMRTKWNTNRFSRGSYSHMPLGSDPTDHEHLAEPIPSKQV